MSVVMNERGESMSVVMNGRESVSVVMNRRERERVSGYEWQRREHVSGYERERERERACQWL